MKSVMAARAGIVLAALVAELYVRGIYKLSVTYEPGIGYVNAPGVARWGIEGMASSSWGPHGERITPGGDDDAPRVLVLGDSFTEALMVEDDAVFPAVAQRELDRLGTKLKLVNAGRSTMSAADFVALAPRYRELFQPAWTVLELRASDLGSDAWTPGRTRFVRDADGQLAVEAVVLPRRTGTSGLLFELRQKSMFLGFGAARVGRFRNAAAREPPLFQASQERPKPQEPPVPPVEEEIDLLVQAWDGRLTILFLTVDDEHEAAVEARLLRRCAERGMSCVSTREAFAAMKAASVEPCGFSNTAPGAGHLNAAGHAVAGRLLFEELTRISGAITGEGR